MKKVFAILAVAAVMASCNNETETKTTETATADSVRAAMTADSLKAVGIADSIKAAAAKNDTSKMPATDTSKKAK